MGEQIITWIPTYYKTCTLPYSYTIFVLVMRTKMNKAFTWTVYMTNIPCPQDHKTNFEKLKFFFNTINLMYES